MSLPLTPNQDAFIDGLVTHFQTFKQALVAALKADNDSSTHLDEARSKRADLTDAYAVLLIELGGNPVQSGALVNSAGPLLRAVDPADPSGTVVNPSLYAPGQNIPRT